MPALVSPAAMTEKRIICERCHCCDHFCKKGKEALASIKKTTLLAAASVETCAFFWLLISELAKAILRMFQDAMETCGAPRTADARDAPSPANWRRYRIEVPLLDVGAVLRRKSVRGPGLKPDHLVDGIVPIPNQLDHGAPTQRDEQVPRVAQVSRIRPESLHCAFEAPEVPVVVLLGGVLVGVEEESHCRLPFHGSWAGKFPIGAVWKPERTKCCAHQWSPDLGAALKLHGVRFAEFTPI